MVALLIGPWNILSKVNSPTSLVEMDWRSESTIQVSLKVVIDPSCDVDTPEDALRGGLTLTLTLMLPVYRLSLAGKLSDEDELYWEEANVEAELGVIGRRVWLGVGDRSESDEVGRRNDGVCGRAVVLGYPLFSTDDGRYARLGGDPRAIELKARG